MDLIYEGITTAARTSCVGSPRGQNGPDLRRDYDQFRFSVPYQLGVRMDLIYEGITTEFSSCRSTQNGDGQNGPDLRRDYDSFSEMTRDLYSVRMDLIYEGITTSAGFIRPRRGCILSQNGPDLRRDYDSSLFFIFKAALSQNGPDLRRDYDAIYSAT